MDAILISIVVMLGLLAGFTIHEHYAYDYSICGKYRKHKKTKVTERKTQNGWEITN